jgi:Fe2+ transport system protein FeoA
MKAEALALGMGFKKHLHALISTSSSLLCDSEIVATCGKGFATEMENLLSNTVDILTISAKSSQSKTVFSLVPEKIVLINNAPWDKPYASPLIEMGAVPDTELAYLSSEALRDLIELEARAILYSTNYYAIEKMKKAISCI